MSNIGTKCIRKLWLEKNFPEAVETLLPDVYLKFSFGDMTEDLLLFLAELSGHKVEGRQTELSIAGIKGHRDCIIDGMLVDVKSASSYSFQKFKDHLKVEDDAFGYLIQIQSYLWASQNDPLVTIKDKAAFLVFDKSSGHMCLDIHQRDDDIDWEAGYEFRKNVLSNDEMPDRFFEDEPDGYKKDGVLIPNGNRKLGVNCSYCSVKSKCWPGLRTFIGSGSPKFLTVVEKEPRMFEVL